MLRLIEQLAGDGEMLDGVTAVAASLGRVHYHLDVYQHFSDMEGETIPASFTVEGRVTPMDTIDLQSLRRRRPEVTLRLTDGRQLRCAITSDDGRLRSTERGMFTV
ncbi:MAG: hypothetical protein DMF89_09090 [Acidobacteria bacterium]|jgi:hypothetical protein|nr:MAG: hypothetical protein DMF90_07860 [Acidobacteriota bacterium]PYR50506.1 MAG: hypothetical protein DMF89_09090 [Acidobacteriota bacterium]